MYPPVKTVIPHQDYTLSILFENGEKGCLDMKPFLHLGVFQRLANYELFKQVRVGFDTLDWPCGVDLDPEFVYRQCATQAVA